MAGPAGGGLTGTVRRRSTKTLDRRSRNLLFIGRLLGIAPGRCEGALGGRWAARGLWAAVRAWDGRGADRAERRDYSLVHGGGPGS